MDWYYLQYNAKNADHNTNNDSDNELQIVDGESKSELLLVLLKNADSVCDEWLGLIAEEDVVLLRWILSLWQRRV